MLIPQSRPQTLHLDRGMLPLSPHKENIRKGILTVFSFRIKLSGRILPSVCQTLGPVPCTEKEKVCLSCWLEFCFEKPFNEFWCQIRTNFPMFSDIALNVLPFCMLYLHVKQCSQH